MRHLPALRWAALGAVVVALAVAAPAGAKSVHGTVVHKNKSQHSFVVAARSGKLTVVSARTSPAISRVVDVKVGRKGVAQRVRARGRARHARLHGRVSFRGPHAFAVSSNGASILVHDNSTPPPVGSTVTTDVTITNTGELESDDVQESNGDNNNTGQNPSAMKIDGAIQAIDTTARTLTLFADDNQEEDSPTAGTSPTVTVHVPATIDMTQFAVGDEAELIVTPQADGSFLLVSVDEINKQGGDGNNQGQNGPEQDDDNGNPSNTPPGNGNGNGGGDGGGGNGGGGGGD
jgi:hypothetical protein